MSWAPIPLVLLGLACTGSAAAEPASPPADPALARLVRDLGSDDPERRREASERLAECLEARPLLEEAQRSGDTETRRRAGAILEGMMPRLAKKCLDRVPPEPWAVVKRTLESAYGRPLSEIFLSIDETPLASASIAQRRHPGARPPLLRDARRDPRRRRGGCGRWARGGAVRRRGEQQCCGQACKSVITECAGFLGARRTDTLVERVSFLQQADLNG